MWKNKKIILAIIFLFFVPLCLKIDNYEDFLENNYIKTPWKYNTESNKWEENHFKINNKECLSKYDWSSVNAWFIPFWTLVTACSNDYYVHFLSSSIKFHFTKNLD